MHTYFFRDELTDNQDEFDVNIERFFTDKYNRKKNAVINVTITNTPTILIYQLR